MSHHDKFWEKFGQKIRQHQPAAYTGGDWASMERLLDKANPPSRKKGWRLLALILLALLGGYLAGAYYGIPTVPEELGSFPIPVSGIAQNRSLQMEVEVATTTRPQNQLSFTKSKNETPTGPTVPSRINKIPNLSNQNLVTDSSMPFSVDNSISPDTPGEGHYQPEEVLSLINAKNAESGAVSTLSLREPMDALSVLPAEQLKLLSPPFPNSAAEYSAPAAQKQGRAYGGLLLGSNLSAPNHMDGSNSLYPFGGAFAGLQLGSRWAIQAEAHIKYADNLTVAYERTEMLESNNGYLFDQVSKRMEERSFLAIEAPLLAQYRLSPNWSLLAGARPALIINDPSISLPLGMEQADIISSANQGQGRSSANGKPALRQFDIGVSLALEWTLNRRWALNACFTRGLTDLSPNRSFQVEEKHFNTDLQLSIRRRF